MGRSPSLSRMSYADLEREIRRRERGVGKLQRKRNTLAAKLAALEDQIVMMGGGVDGGGRRPGGGGPRPKNDMTLNEALAKVLSGKTMSVTDAAEAVQKAGYKTGSATFRTQVNIALIKGPFKRVGRGEYTAK